MNNPHDAPIRAALVDTLRQAHPGVLLVQEYPLGTARADLAALHSSLDIYEIKSAADSRARLERQANAYARVADHCIAVVAPRHLAYVVQQLPTWWGLVVWDAGMLRPARSPQPNPEQQHDGLAWLLWQPEALAVARAHQVVPTGQRGYCGKGALVMALRQLPLLELRNAVLAALRARPTWRLDDGRSVRGAELAASLLCKTCQARRRRCKYSHQLWCLTCDQRCSCWRCRRTLPKETPPCPLE